MRTLFLIPIRDDTGAVRVQGGSLEMYFANVDDLKIALWKARIDPTGYKRELTEVQNGFRASIPVTHAQWKAFYK